MDEQRALVKKHLELESRAIDDIRSVLPHIKDEKVKLVLNAILSDELRHHDLLKRLLKDLLKPRPLRKKSGGT